MVAAAEVNLNLYGSTEGTQIKNWNNVAIASYSQQKLLGPNRAKQLLDN